MSASKLTKMYWKYIKCYNGRKKILIVIRQGIAAVREVATTLGYGKIIKSNYI